MAPEHDGTNNHGRLNSRSSALVERRKGRTYRPRLITAQSGGCQQLAEARAAAGSTARRLPRLQACNVACRCS